MSNDQLHYQDAIQETEQITRFVDDVTPEHYEKPAVSSNVLWKSSAGETMKHSIESILSRPVVVLDSTFSDAFTEKVLNFPGVLFGASANIRNKLNYFEFFRANIKVKLLFNATPFQQGRYWIYFSPYDTLSNRGKTGTLQNATGYPGVELDIANGAPVELTIPYCAPLSHYRLPNAESTMGELVITPIVNLTSGTAMDNAPFTVMAWFEDIELSMPTNQVIDATPTLRAQMDEEQQANNTGMISAVATKVASVAEVIGDKIPSVSAISKPVAWASRAVAGVSSAFGFNKPKHLHATCTYANVPGKGYTNMDGLDNSAVLGAAPDNAIENMSGLFSSAVDEMDLDFVKKKSCIVKQAIQWTTTQASGVQLYYFQNAPGCLDTGTDDLDPTTLCFLASMFRFWRGGIKYRLTCAKTAFHTGRLRIGFIPAGGPTTPAAGNNLQFTHNWVLDLSKSSEIEFTVPYVSNRPWTDIVLGNRANGQWAGSSRRTGTLVFEILTPLRAASTAVDQDVTLTLWHSGAQDLEFAAPEFTQAKIADESVTLVANEFDELSDKFATMNLTDEPLRAQIFNATDAAIEHKEQMMDSSVPMFEASRQDYVGPEKLGMGEKISSLRQLIKRFGTVVRGVPTPYWDDTQATLIPTGPYSRNSSTALNECVFGVNLDPAYFGEKDIGAPANPEDQRIALANSIDAAGVPVGIGNQVVVGQKLPVMAPINYISYLYRFYRGGKRYKIMMPANGNTRAFSQLVGSSSGRGVRQDVDRTSKPWIIKKERDLLENGTIFGIQFLKPDSVANQATLRDLTGAFEHLHFPDINGVIEFEVPYYSPLPISLVAEGTLANTNGALVTRSRVNCIIGPHEESYRNGELFWSAGANFPAGNRVYLDSIGEIRVMTAAADDFSFGYMVGAPKIKTVL